MVQPSEKSQTGSLSLIALGSNASSSFGSPFETVTRAVAALTAAGLEIVAQSRFYRTPAFPPGIGENFVNAVVQVRSAHDAQGLLALLHGIEAEFGRHRTIRWGARTLDLDLIDHEGELRPDRAGWQAWRDLPLEQQRVQAPDRLILPHPRVQDRAFVLVPLADVAPEWRHPVTGASAQAMLDALPHEHLTGIAPLFPADHQG
ncbi:2-amino-4-hydroxy-6-hydroxymethyldihydropteridine diphosphokinase [Pacificitalea manganoxidans]|uniref:2-amino-4-hydroxy-6-hydroxymethyldihydropteridine pyrophosphokinase n=1 Tax=Pacificitalea manganoxidans TaxID=1411902 RepID=A0A291LW03_9RHOB|nr:2-amino-4-hydroxy-6-hydroxymethyldihydropteridine diphosphokinase [Pacificitalea manganoxidans]ATI40872.1 2-amino-4-hydroxy-6-hydroxymethyldihydropteridine diphosphokinase [Pacificitalea manganoxidans]